MEARANITEVHAVRSAGTSDPLRTEIYPGIYPEYTKTLDIYSYTGLLARLIKLMDIYEDAGYLRLLNIL